MEEMSTRHIDYLRSLEQNNKIKKGIYEHNIKEFISDNLIFGKYIKIKNINNPIILLPEVYFSKIEYRFWVNKIFDEKECLDFKGIRQKYALVPKKSSEVKSVIILMINYELNDFSIISEDKKIELNNLSFCNSLKVYIKFINTLTELKDYNYSIYAQVDFKYKVKELNIKSVLGYLQKFGDSLISLQTKDYIKYIKKAKTLERKFLR